MTEPNLATLLMAERTVSRVLLTIAGNLATQLALHEGVDPTTVRAVVARAVDEVSTFPRDPAAFGLMDEVVPKPDPVQSMAIARPVLVTAVAQILGAATIKSPRPKRPN